MDPISRVRDCLIVRSFEQYSLKCLEFPRKPAVLFQECREVKEQSAAAVEEKEAAFGRAKEHMDCLAAKEAHLAKAVKEQGAGAAEVEEAEVEEVAHMSASECQKELQRLSKNLSKLGTPNTLAVEQLEDLGRRVDYSTRILGASCYFIMVVFAREEKRERRWL